MAITYVYAGQKSVRASIGKGSQQVVSAGNIKPVKLIDIASILKLEKANPTVVTESALAWKITSGGISKTITLSKNGTKYSLSGKATLYAQSITIKSNLKYSSGSLHFTGSGKGNGISVSGSGTANIKSRGQVLFSGTGSIHISGLHGKVRLKNKSLSASLSGNISGTYFSGTARNKGKYIFYRITASYGGKTRSVSSQLYFNYNHFYSQIVNGYKTTASSLEALVTSAVAVSKAKLESRKACSVSAVIGAGGVQIVERGGLAKSSLVHSGGVLKVLNGGEVRSANIASAGAIYISKGATAASLVVSSGGKAFIAGGAFAGNVTMHGAIVNVTAAGGKITTFKANSATRVNFDIRNITPGKPTMLTVTKKPNSQPKLIINTAKTQKAGTYKLSAGFKMTSGKAVTVMVAQAKAGTVKLGKAKLSSNGMSYKLSINAANVISLKISLDNGCVTKSKGKLKGTTNCDIFYGGKGNDTITGLKGRDVVVYDKSIWGKDTIVKTNGTMTLLFKDLKKTDIVQNLSGTTMTITRKGLKNQAIAIQGWNAATHNIVFASGKMAVFDKYLKATKANNFQISAARKETFKKAGLATA